MCYIEYNLEDNRPKIARCGHSICGYCIGKMTSCPLCITPFKCDTYSHNPYIDAFPPILPSRRLQPLPQTLLKDNHALVELLERKNNVYDLCYKTKEYNEFYCLECKVITCPKCIETSHRTHVLKKLLPETVLFERRTQQSIELVNRRIDKNADIEGRIGQLREEISDLMKLLPDRIDNVFTEMIGLLIDAKEEIQSSLKKEAESKLEKLAELSGRLTENSGFMKEVREALEAMKEAIRANDYKETPEQVQKFEGISSSLREMVQGMEADDNMVRLRTELAIDGCRFDRFDGLLRHVKEAIANSSKRAPLAPLCDGGSGSKAPGEAEVSREYRLYNSSLASNHSLMRSEDNISHFMYESSRLRMNYSREEADMSNSLQHSLPDDDEQLEYL